MLSLHRATLDSTTACHLFLSFIKCIILYHQQTQSGAHPGTGRGIHGPALSTGPSMDTPTADSQITFKPMGSFSALAYAGPALQCPAVHYTPVSASCGLPGCSTTHTTHPALLQLATVSSTSPAQLAIAYNQNDSFCGPDCDPPSSYRLRFHPAL